MIRPRISLIRFVFGENRRWLSTSINPRRARNVDSPTSSSGDESSHSESEHSTEAEAEPTVEDIQKIVLGTALEFVPIYGWTVDSLAEAAKQEGYPGVAHGMFPRGGGDLMHHFVKECNSQLAEQLAKETSRDVEEGERKKTGALIRDALESRLRMITPYHEQWPQAMALTAHPENIAEHFTNLASLMDTIWYHAGDRSADFNWYTKRLSLAAVYKSTELCFIQDKSPDFEETWRFLDNRLADFTRFAKFRGEARNVAGLNSRK